MDWSNWGTYKMFCLRTHKQNRQHPKTLHKTTTSSQNLKLIAELYFVIERYFVHVYYGWMDPLVGIALRWTYFQPVPLPVLVTSTLHSCNTVLVLENVVLHVVIRQSVILHFVRLPPPPSFYHDPTYWCGPHSLALNKRILFWKSPIFLQTPISRIFPMQSRYIYSNPLFSIKAPFSLKTSIFPLYTHNWFDSAFTTANRGAFLAPSSCNTQWAL